MHVNRKSIAVGVGIALATLGVGLAAKPLVWMGWLSFVKHGGDDDLDIAIMEDHQAFHDSAKPGHDVRYLSEWHNGPRHYDWWEQKTAAGETLFVYRYWNPFWETGERVSVTVDIKRGRPWPKADFARHPAQDYPILTISNKGDHASSHRWY